MESFPPHFPAPEQIEREELSSTVAATPGKVAGELTTLMKKGFTQELHMKAWNPRCGAMLDFTCCIIRLLFFLFSSFLKLPFPGLLKYQGVGICLLDFLVVVSLWFLVGGQSQNKQGSTGDGSCLRNNVCQSGLCFSTLAVPVSDISLSR